MGWQVALIWCAIGLIAVCVLTVAYCVLRDRSLRGTRISNEELMRERVTISIPFMHPDYKDRV